MDRYAVAYDGIQFVQKHARLQADFPFGIEMGDIIHSIHP